MTKDLAMPYCGVIRMFDQFRDVGTIMPEGGGEPIPFKLSAVQASEQLPLPGQHFSYETHQVNGGMTRAVDLVLLAEQPGILEQQARSQCG